MRLTIASYTNWEKLHWFWDEWFNQLMQEEWDRQLVRFESKPITNEQFKRLQKMTQEEVKNLVIKLLDKKLKINNI